MRLPIDDLAREQLRPYILECFKLMGKDMNTCEQCGITDIPLDIHHTKYDGATVYDLQLICRSCNLSKRNRLLA